MAGINPQTGQFDLNYNPPIDYSSIAGYNQNLTSTVPQTTIPSYSQPGVTAPGSIATPQFGLNLDSLKTGMGVLQTGANIYSAFEQASIAKQQLAYAQTIGNANLANQMASYNTTLGSQAAMDAKVGGWTPAQTTAYTTANQLTGK